MSNNAMSNETDLDWLARNVHEWPAGDHQPWCYVYWKGGKRAVSGNCITAIQPCVRVELSEWLARRAELQNKPAKWPIGANWLAQDKDGEWWFYTDEIDNPPQNHGEDNWYSDDVAVRCRLIGEVIGDWRDTLEKRPEEFKQFTSIEDNQELSVSQEHEMKQDNGWLERGELPPVGEVCEILGAFGHYQEWFECKIIAEHNGSVFAANERSWMNVRKGERQFRPLRTERDVLIEIINKTDDTDDRIADAILAAGFSLGAK